MKEKKKLNQQDWFEYNVRKINFIKSLGFEVSLVELCNDKWYYTEQQHSTEDIINHIENANQYQANIHTSQNPIIWICCSPLASKMLEFKTLHIELGTYSLCHYFFKYDQFTFDKLSEITQKSNQIAVFKNFDMNFTKTTMPKVTVPEGKDYKLRTLPYLEMSQIEKLQQVNDLLDNNKEAQFQINNNTRYRIPKIILDLLSTPYLTLNDKKVFEKILLTITNSTFAITKDTINPFRIKFKDFTKDLKLSRNKQTQEELVRTCFENLRKYNLVDTCEINKDTNTLTFYASALAEKISYQNIQREFGFYNNVPGTKRGVIISAWLDYLYMINSFTRHNKTLQISLDSLLAKLHLNPLLQKHRISEIADILNELLAISNKYGLTEGECIFDSEIVKDLLKDRKGLKKYIHLVENTTIKMENIENDEA